VARGERGGRGRRHEREVPSKEKISSRSGFKKRCGSGSALLAGRESTKQERDVGWKRREKNKEEER